jgi:hypothetical protein
VAAVVAGGGACAGGDPGSTPTGDRVFVADPKEIQVAPGGTGSARFVLTSGGVPIAAQPVTFEVLAEAGSEGKGATLAQVETVTDGSGVATVDVTAGEETVFRIAASAGSLEAELVVFVAVSAGSVVVAPFFAPNSSAPEHALSIEVQLWDRTSCAEINVAKPQNSPRNDPRSLPPSGGTTRYDNVSTTQTSAVVGRALGSGTVAIGCVDLLGQSLVPNGVVQVALPLRDTSPDPVGTYMLSSPLQFVPPLAAGKAIAEAWRDLGDCPLDPAQLFLDCTIDALSSTAGDKLDCVPNLVPGGEGPLGDALIARRGTMIVDLAGMVTNCRAATDGTGAPSLDAIAMGLFGTPTPPLVVALPAIGADAAHILDRVDLTSSLAVRSTGRPDQYVVTHVLTGARFGSEVVTLASLALPALTAYATATTRDGLLVIADHGFTLRLGRVGRAGLGLSALKPRLPGEATADAGTLINALAKLSVAQDGVTNGCAALDLVMCAAAGRDANCTGPACPAGLSALVTRLDAAFDAADGADLDLYLSGSAPLIDMHGNGVAHQLGSNVSEPNAIASWEVDLRTAAGPARLTTSFTGTRTGN